MFLRPDLRAVKLAIDPRMCPVRGFCDLLMIVKFLNEWIENNYINPKKNILLLYDTKLMVGFLYHNM